MKGKKRILGAFLTVALIIMQVPGMEADASTSASSFQMDGSTLTNYRGTEKNVSIPDTVRTIGQGAFENDTNIELVVVPNSVKRIEAYAFWGCENLDTVVLGKGLSEVGEYAFTNCTGLEQISIPTTVTSIGVEAFKDCANLKDITIPPETVNIDESAFDGCYQLTIHYEKGSAAEEYAKAFYERQKDMPGYVAPTPVPKPSDIIQSIIAMPTPDPTPQETPVPTQVPVENGVVLGISQIVGNKAMLFMDNTKLQVFGGEGTQNRGDEGGESVPEIPESGVTEQPSQGNTVEGAIPKHRIVDGQIVADQAYYRSGNLESMTLPDGIVEIGQLAFARSSLTSIALPQGVEHISYGAFYHCSQLAQVDLPESVMCVEPKAFEHSLWVDSFLTGGTDGNENGSAAAGDFLVSGGVLVAYRGEGSQVTIPEGVRVIAGEVFQNHTEIEKVVLPDSLLVVGEAAFQGCSGLKDIVIGKNVAEIKDRAFLGNTVAEITLPVSVKKVGLQAFGNTILAYGGPEAEYTYEDSATKLANEAYRVYDGMEDGEPGVTVEGLEEVSATLEDAARNYILTVETPEDISEMKNAFQRAFQSDIPENMTIYNLTLLDASGIPLIKLGNQALWVVLPVSETLQGHKLQLVVLDRNGQLESVATEQIMLDDREGLRFKLDYATMIGVWSVD